MARYKEEDNNAIKQKAELSEHGKIKLLILVAMALLIISLIVYVVGISAAPSQKQLSLSTCAGYFNTLEKYQCVDFLANSTDNLTECSMLPGYQADVCYYDTALGRHNISACSRITANTTTTASAYDNCVISLANSPADMGYCGTLSINDGLRCIYNISVRAGFSNASACDQISSAFFGNECRYLDFYYQAQQMKDAADCGYLQPTANDTTLSLLLMNNETGFSTNPNLTIERALLPAYYLQQNVSPRDYCYLKLAQSESNRSICSLATTKTGGALCNATFEGTVV